MFDHQGLNGFEDQFKFTEANMNRESKMSHLKFGGAILAGFAMVGFATAAQATQGVSDNEVVFGMHTALSGPAATWGTGAAAGVRMRFDEVNEAGGIHGRKLKLIVEDHQYQVPRAIQAGNKLINRDKIFAMLGALGTPMNNAVLKQQLAKKIPNLFPFTSARSMVDEPSELKFIAASTYYDQSRAGVKYFIDMGKKKICSLYQDTDFGHEARDAARDQTKAQGLEVIAEAAYTPRNTDYVPAITKLRGAGCEVVAMGSIIKDTIIPVATAKKMGWKDVVFVGNIASYDHFTAAAKGGVTEGYYAVTGFEFAYADQGTDVMKAWVKRFTEKNGKPPFAAAQLGYNSADIVVAALQKAGKNLTTESLLNALESMEAHGSLFGGSIYSFSKTKHQGTDKSTLAQVKNGRWVTIKSTIGY